MATRGRVLILLAIASCAYGKMSQPARAGDANTKVVASVIYIASPVKWRESRYWRISDAEAWPKRIVVAPDDSICWFPDHEVNEPHRFDYYSCPTPWRFPRS